MQAVVVYGTTTLKKAASVLETRQSLFAPWAGWCQTATTIILTTDPKLNAAKKAFRAWLKAHKDQSDYLEYQEGWILVQVLDGELLSALWDRVELAEGEWDTAVEDSFGILEEGDGDHPEIFSTLAKARAEAKHFNGLNDEERAKLLLLPRHASGDIVVAYFSQIPDED